MPDPTERETPPRNGADDASLTMSTKTRLMTILIGAGVSALLSSALVIATAKAGISPGVSPLVVLFGWIACGAMLGPRLRPFLSLLQVTGSGGVAVSAGVVFTAPIVQIFARNLEMEVPAVDLPVMMLASLAGSFIGWGFVGLATERFLTDPKLPAPEAVACDRLIQTAAEHPDRRPPIVLSLVPGLVLGSVMKALLHFKVLPDKLASVNLGGWGKGVELPVPLSPVYLGIGALLTLPTALMIFGGSLIHGLVTAYSGANEMPTDTFRWVGGAAMCVAVIWSLGRYAVEGARVRANPAPAAADLDLDLITLPPATRRRQWIAIAIGAVGMLGMMGMLGATVLQIAAIGIVSIILASFLSGLGALLSLQVGASASPVSGTTFMGMLVLSLTGLGVGLSGADGILFLVPVVVATCVAVCAANDASQDYKTVQLNHFKVSDHLNGQMVGLAVGAIVVPLTLSIAHESSLAQNPLAGLGSDDLPCPQASFFATVLSTLFLDGTIPWNPVLVGAALGVLAVVLEEIGRLRSALLSSLALAVGIYLPSEIGCGIMLGAMARFVATRQIASSTHTGILNAAGLITGYAFTALAVGLAIVSGWSGKIGLAEDYDSGSAGPRLLGGLLLGATLFLVTYNYAKKWSPDDDEDRKEGESGV